MRLNRRRGTATIAVEVPGPGIVALDGSVPQQRQVEAAGKVTLRVLPKRRVRRLLDRRGSARLKLTITFIPRGGTPAGRDLSLRLKKEPRG